LTSRVYKEGATVENRQLHQLSPNSSIVGVIAIFRQQSARRLDKIQPMVWKQKILRFALRLFLCANTVCFAQTITIRLVDLTNQSPISNQHVYVFGLSGKAEMKEEKVRLELSNPLAADMTLVTDIKGEATFDLPKSVPPYFYVRAQLSGRHWDCFCGPRIATAELVQKGIVVRNDERKAEPSIQPKAKELLFALRPTPWWVRVFWPLLKD